MPKLLKSKTKQSIYKEYKKLKVPSRAKKITVKKRILIAVAILVLGSFTHAKLFNSSAAPVNDRDAKKVVSCAYSAFMGRIPDRAGAKYWEARYIRTNYNPTDLAKGLLYSREGQREANQSGFKEFMNRSYEACLNRQITTAEYNLVLEQYRNGLKKEEIFTLVIKAGDKPVSFPKEEKCKKFLKGGSVTPICRSGSAGTSNDVVVTEVSGTNIIVNKAWVSKLTQFRSSANSAGYNLQAYTDPSLANKKLRCANGANLLKSPGSFRSAADQACLTYLGYPTATGTSMHQWGLAIDLTCNGKPLASSGNCLTWVRNNAPSFGIYNNSGEAWHFSTTGH